MARSKQKQVVQEEEADEEYTVEKIKDHKRVKSGLKYHIKWLGFDKPSDDTWEPEDSVRECKELLKEYWDAKPLSSQLERYPVNSSQYKKIKSQIDAGGVSDDEDEDEDDEEEDDKRSSRSGSKKKGSTPKKKVVKKTKSPAAKKRKSKGDEEEDEEEAEEGDERKANGGSPKKKKPAKRSKKEEPAIVEESPVLEQQQPEEQEAEQAREDEEMDSEDGYDTAGRTETEWTKVVVDGGDGSWEDLIEKIDTVERDGDDGLKMLCIWKKKDDTSNLALESWVNARITRRTAPQRMLDFYELNLKFKPRQELEGDEQAEPTDNVEEGEGIAPAPAAEGASTSQQPQPLQNGAGGDAAIVEETPAVTDATVEGTSTSTSAAPQAVEPATTVEEGA